MRHPLFSTVLALSLGTATTPVVAQHHHHGMRHFDHHQHRVGSNWGWVAPAVIGGAVVYGITRPVVVQQQPVYIQQPVAPATVVIDGVVYVKQIMIVDGIAQEVLVRQ
jgi:hypothetical protein